MALAAFARRLAAALSMALTAAAGAAEPLVLAAATLPLSLPVRIAQVEGYFAAEGLQVRVADCPFGRVCLRRLLDGQADFATVADLPVALAGFETDRFAVVGTITTNTSDTRLIAHAASGIGGAADLAGKTVGMVAGTTAQYVLDMQLLLAGVDPAALRIVAVTPDDAASRLQQRELDAVALMEPYAGGALRALGAQAHALAGRRIYQLHWNLVVARGAGGVRRSDTEIAALLRAIDRAEQLIQREPARAKAALAQWLRLTPAEVELLWPSQSYALTLPQSLLTTLEGQARWALRAGHARGQPPNMLRLLHDAPLRRVRADAVTLAH